MRGFDAVPWDVSQTQYPSHWSLESSVLPAALWSWHTLRLAHTLSEPHIEGSYQKLSFSKLGAFCPRIVHWLKPSGLDRLPLIFAVIQLLLSEMADIVSMASGHFERLLQGQYVLATARGMIAGTSWEERNLWPYMRRRNRQSAQVGEELRGASLLQRPLPTTLVSYIEVLCRLNPHIVVPVSIERRWQCIHLDISMA